MLRQLMISIILRGICMGGIFTIAWTACQLALAQTIPAPDFDILRVFVPADQMSELITPEHVFLELDELSEKLRERETQRRTSILNTPSLQEAIYVVRHQEGVLTSELSRWELQGLGAINLGDWSIALHPAASIDKRDDQLLDNQLVSPGGETELQLPGGMVKRWFGFSLAGSRNDPRVFRFQLPVATSARMLVSTSQLVELTSTDVVIEHVQTPTDYLPADWPSDNSFTLSSSLGRQWWLIRLSGKQRFEILAEQKDSTSDERVERLVRKADLQYLVQPSKVDLSARFELLQGSSHSGRTRIRLAENLRVSSLAVNQIAIPWQIHRELNEDANFIEFDPSFLTTGGGSFNDFDSGRSSELSELAIPETLEIEVVASCPKIEEQNTPIADYLPEIAIADSFTISGTTRVLSSQGFPVDSVLGTNCSIRCSLSNPAQDQSLGFDSDLLMDQVLSELVWNIDWVGHAPNLQATAARRLFKWTAHSLTRFTANPDWLSANCRILIESEAVDSNEIKLPVGERWFIDRVRLVGQPDAEDVRVEYVEGMGSEGAATEIVVTWDQQRDQLSFDLEVIAHRPLTDSSERIRRLLTVPYADQVDNYILEPTTKYQVEVDASLIRFQRQVTDLPLWQQRLIPQSSEKWIFQGIRRTVPGINLVATEGTYSAQWYTWLRTDNEIPVAPNASVQADRRYQLNYAIRVIPISGVLDAITLRVPASPATEELVWEMRDPTNEREKLSATVVQRDQNSTVLELRSSNFPSIPFTLLCSLPVSSAQDGILSVGIPALEAAENCQSTLILPAEMLLRSETHDAVEPMTMDILPMEACCSDIDLANLFGLAPLSPVEQIGLVAARLESEIPRTLRLATGTSPRQGWILSERIEHWIDGKSIRTHQVVWNIETANDSVFKVALPSDWTPIDLVINGEAASMAASTSERELSIPIQVGSPTLIRLTCTSQDPKPGWLHVERLPRPQSSYPVLDSSQSVFVPPHQSVFSFEPDKRESARLIERLFPRSWWQWLAPSHPAIDLTASSQLGWIQIDLGGDIGDAKLDDPSGVAKEHSYTTASSIWIVDRGAMAAICLSAVILMSSIAFWLIGKSILRGWFMLGGMAVLLVIVPVQYVGIVQMIALAMSIACLLRLVQVVIRRRSSTGSARSGQRSGTISRRALVNPTTMGIATAFSLGFSALSLVSAQVPFQRATTPQTTGELMSNQKNESPLFNVLIPVEDTDFDGTYDALEGSFVYVPQALYELLYRPDSLNSGSTAPKLLSADYTLRLNPTTTASLDLVQEFSVEYGVLIRNAELPLRLPILSSELELLRFEIDGQLDLFSGNIVRQDPDDPDAITFKAYSPGRYSLKLYFRPTVELSLDGRASLQVGIPSVPSANLRVFCDPSTQASVQSQGRQQQVGNQLTVALGPVDEIECSWQSRDLNTRPSLMTEFESHLWVHACGNQLIAIARIDVLDTSGLPELFRVVVDENWEAIGSDWADAELVSTQSYQANNRRAYTARLNNRYEGSESNAKLRIMLTPKSTGIGGSLTSLPIPFVAIQEARQLSERTLTWSAAAGSDWSTDANAIWPVYSESEARGFVRDNWGNLGLSDDYSVFRVPIGSRTSSLTRNRNSKPAILSEITQIHVSFVEAKVQYQAQFDEPRTNSTSLRFRIPEESRVESLLVDGVPWDYQVLEKEGNVTLLAICPAEVNELQMVDVEVSYPIRVGRPSVLKRIVLTETEANSSILRVLRRDGLECLLQADEDSNVELVRVSARPTELLANLEAVVGQADLGNRFRESSDLPIHFTVRPPSSDIDVESVIYVQRGSEGWIGKLEVHWISNVPPDFLFFEVPTVLRDSLQLGQVPRSFIPMGDSSRTTLAVLAPQEIEGQTRLTFEFPLTTSNASQSLSIPKIRILANQPLSPVVALPTHDNGNRLNWLATGAQLDPNWKDPFEPVDGYQYVRYDQSTLQATWETETRMGQHSVALFSRVAIEAIEPGNAFGRIDYWVDPQGQSEFELRIPKGLKVVGALIGERPAAIHQTPDGRLAVLLQPNYALLPLRLLARWEVDSRARELELVLPQTPSKGSLESWVDIKPDRWILASKRATRNPSDYVWLWARSLDSAAANMRGFSDKEIDAWLRSWHPKLLGIDEEANLPGDAEPGESVAEFWLALCERLQVVPTLVEPSQNIPIDLHQRQMKLPSLIYVTETPSMILSTVPTGIVVYPKLIAAGMLVLLIAVFAYAGRYFGQRYIKLLSQQPWVYWLQLACLTWILIPTIWPAFILALSAAFMATGQFLDYRKVRQYQ